MTTNDKQPQAIENFQNIPRCGAKTRSGKPCQNPCVKGKKRCRLHGGAKGSGAPRGNKNAWKHGRRSAAAIAERKEINQLFVRVRQIFRNLETEREQQL